MIELKGLWFRYSKEFILEDINLKVTESDFISIMGANGSGKTTLAKHLNGLLLPTKGFVKVDGMDTKKDSFEIRKRVGMLFQNPDDQLIHSIVDEDVAFGLENLNLPTGLIQKKVTKILSLLKISHLAKKNVNSLSFGQKQLVALAGVIVMEPKYIVCDEPTTMLDPQNKKNIMELLSLLNKKGMTIILITNNLKDINYAKRSIIIKNGKIIFDDKVKKLSDKIFRRAEING